MTKSSQVHQRTEVMSLWALLACLDQVRNVSRLSEIISTYIYCQAKQSVILTQVKTTRLRSRKKTPTSRNICSPTRKQILFLHQVSSTYFTNDFQAVKHFNDFKTIDTLI